MNLKYIDFIILVSVRLAYFVTETISNCFSRTFDFIKNICNCVETFIFEKYDVYGKREKLIEMCRHEGIKYSDELEPLITPLDKNSRFSLFQ